MHVGVAGGTGFLGSRLVERLRDRGDEVRVYSRKPEAGERSLPPGVELARWNALEEPLPPAHLDGLDAVVNLLGIPVAGLWTRGRKERMRVTRVEGTRNLVEGMRAAGTAPAVLVSSSGVNVYGSRGDRVLAEDTEPGTGYLAELATAWEAEARAAEDLGVRVVLLRTAPPLDATGGLLQILARATRWGGGVVLGDGEQWMPWIHIDDWLRLVLFLLDSDTARGAFNAAAPHPATQRTFAKALAHVVGRPAPWRVPAVLLRLAGDFAGETVLASVRAVPAKALGLGFRFRYGELKPALWDLLG